MIRDLHRKGVSITEIARQTGRDRKTIRKVIRGSSYRLKDKLRAVQGPEPAPQPKEV